MQDKYYPPINQSHLRIMLKLMNEHSDYLTDKSCPYDADIKSLLTETQGNKKKPNAAKIDLDALNEDDLSVQINTLYADLQSYGSSINSDPEASATDRNTYFRLSTALLEKLVQIREKALNMKQYAAFQQEILNIMDEVLNADQKKEITERLKRFVGETV